MSRVHVIPINDLIEHVTEDSDGCVCGPELEYVDDGLVVTHHALDGREHNEPDHDRAACPGCTHGD